MSKQALERLKEKFGDAAAGVVLESISTRQGDESATIAAGHIREVCQFLKDDPELDFKMLSTVTCVDRLLLATPTPRFELIYQLLSLKTSKRLRLKVFVDEASPEVDTVRPVWKTADWWERHIWDMYGVKFKGHPNLKRLYMYEEFVGHPLRKDYPLKGRQPLVKERNFRDLVRGPGATPRN